jgi:hypothetical protein
MSQKIIPSLWFDTEAEEAAAFYTSIFKNARILSKTHYTEGSPREAGTVMTVEWELDGQRFTGINGGPQFKFDEAVSFQITCEDQDEVDHYWDAPHRGRQRESVRLAQGQVRPLLAGRAEGDGRGLLQPRPRGGPARDAGDAQDEEDRHRRAARGGGRCAGELSRRPDGSPLRARALRASLLSGGWG